MREVTGKQVALACWSVQPTLVRIHPAMTAKLTAKAAKDDEKGRKVTDNKNDGESLTSGIKWHPTTWGSR